MNPWRWSLLRSVLAAAVALGAVGPAVSAAQIIIGGKGLPVVPPADSSQTDAELAQNVFLQPERIVLQRLAKAQELLGQGRYGEAVRYLGAILEGPEDYFFQPDKKNEPGTHRSLKAEAQRLIGQMPRKGRELYELQYGARARQMLAEALSAGEVARVAEVSRRFFHTQAGYEATLLLGLNHLDHARPLAGALTLHRLRKATQTADQFEPTLSLAMATCWLQAGMDEKARDALLALKERQGDALAAIGGEQVAAFGNDAGAVEWLVGLIGPQSTADPAEADRWLMFRGNASRNATTAGSAPLLNMRWWIPATDDPMMEGVLRQLHAAYLEHGVPALPALHPLAVHKEFVIQRPNKAPWRVEDVVLMRTARNLLAVDFGTGKRLWEAPAEDPLKAMTANTARNSTSGQWFQWAPALGYRMWDDATYGTISSDGQYVFSIEDLPMGISTSSSSRRIVIGGVIRQAPAPKPCNRLAAHDIRTGKLKWHLGGPAEQFALRQAETFFLGPPLPLMERLYVLAEVKEEIRLMALDARTGDLLWSQQLATVERDVLQDPLRRLAGASPSYADGILICPTSTGAVVAVDLATRSLLWGYRYGRPTATGGRSAVVLRVGTSAGSRPPQRWCDATATVVDGRVLVTPVESDSLHCLNLIDGELRWKYQRQDDLYVACVHQEKVVLVGRNQVRALGLADGKPAWDGRAVRLPEGSMPSGRGCLGGNNYFVPLTTAEVIAIDLVAGAAGHLAKSRKGNVPGNLVFYRGRVLSQAFDGLETYYQLESVREEVARRLAARPDDPVALSLRGEILLDEGKQPEAIACFRRAYQLDTDPRTRNLLRDSLLRGLQLDFAAHRDRTDEIEQLLDDPQQRSTYLRLVAAGLRQAGQWSAALDHYLELVELDRDGHVMEQVTKSLSVRRDRWLQAQLAALRREAKEEAAAVIDGPIEARLQAALKASEAAPLRRFLEYFGNHPTADKARGELVRRLRASGKLLEAEITLWNEWQSSDRAIAGPATAELAGLLRASKRPQDAASCYSRLGEEFADVVCGDGKTGKELLEALPDDGPVGQVLYREHEWPLGAVEVKVEPPKSPRTSIRGRYALPYQGSRVPFFSETTIRFDQSRRMIHGCDSLGNEQWQASLVEAGTSNSVPYNPNLTYGCVRGHLLLLSMGYKLFAFDTLDLSDDGKAKLLWTQDLIDLGLDAANLRRLAVQVPNLPWQLQQFHLAQYYGNQTSTLGPVTDSYVCFQRSRNLVAADPLSGETLWVRRGVAPQSMLFGDEQFVFAVAPGETEATVFRALDGELLAKRNVPRIKPAEPVPAGNVVLMPFGIRQVAPVPFGQSCVATLGRQILVWREEGSGRALELFDPWEQQAAWPPRKFASGAKTDLVGHEAVGVLEPDGHFVLLALPGGRTIAEVELEPERSLLEIVVFRSGDQYILVTHSPPSRPVVNQMPIQPMPGTLYKPISRGRVYSFDLQGTLTWPSAAEIENQYLLLNQPGRLPVLTFARQEYQRNARRSTERYKVAILCLDKRDGRKVYDDARLSGSTSLFELVGDPEKNTVELRTLRNTVTLTFTNKPIPPPSETEVDKGGQPPKTTRTLLQAVTRAVAETLEKAAESAKDKDDAEQPLPVPPPDE